MDKSMSGRCAKLAALGMHFDGDSYVGTDDIADFNIHHTEIALDTDEVFYGKIERLTEEKKARETV